MKINFDKIKQIVTKTAKDAVKISGDAVEYTKLAYKVSELKDDVKNTYAQIGEMIYKSSLGEEMDSDKVEELCAYITNVNEEIEVLSSTLNSIGNKKVCSSCGAKMTSESNFCSKCGEKTE